ncbi:hypothetical protein DRW42_08305 [Pedobacter miscanthi]|uniref:Carboxypeptidase-like regulatory domain-containing protein n=2 Tax=Pedobacter miscanthi TaxID=2259170 RepID=A0A366L4J1_9SPHI|nr:hypothetical protein DRW42_08305 [Pedobacter miscanthi]
MSSNFKIQISNPCHEKWGDMIDNNMGKFCNSCQKSVVDFTNFSDSDLQNWFIKNQGNSCGRFKSEQLDRLIHGKSNYTISKFKPSLIAASLFAFLSLPKLSKGETIKPSMVQTARAIINFDEKLGDEKLSDSIRVIRGKITDKDKTALQWASIHILGGKSSCSTDIKGEFSLTYPIYEKNESKELEIRFIGFKNKVVKIKPTDSYVNITLDESDEILMGDIVVMRISPWKKLYFKIRNQVRDINPFYTKRN